MSDSALASMVAALGAKQLKGLAPEVEALRQQAERSEQAEKDARAAAVLEDIDEVPSELLDPTEIDPKAEFHWTRHSEGAGRAKGPKER